MNHTRSTSLPWATPTDQRGAMMPRPPKREAPVREWARYYHSLGLHPVPVRPRTKFPSVRWTEYQTRQPTLEEIDGWNWSGGVGIVTTNLIVVDCDKGGEALIGERELPASWTVQTGGGGLHRYYSADGKPRRNAVGILKGDNGAQVDVRADGGFVILPPTRHCKTGKPYWWKLPPNVLPLAPAPAWIREAMTERDSIPEGQSEYEKPPWVTELLRGVSSGQRNNAASRLAGYFCDKGHPEDITFEILRGFGERCTPPMDPHQLQDTVRSIYRTAQRRGHTIGRDIPPEDPGPTERFSLPLSKLLSVPDEPIPYLAERLLVAGANGFIGGEPKSLKSWVALHVALCLSLSTPVFGRYAVPNRVRVLFISEEDGERRVRRRIRKLLTGLGMDPPEDDYFRYAIKVGVLLDDREWIERLRGELKEYQPAIVIGDVFELMHGKDADKRSDMKPVFRNLDWLREEFGCGFLLADHFKKATIGGSRRGGQRLSGTVGKHAFGESSIYLFPAQGINRVRVETELKDGPSEVFGLALEDTEGAGVRFTWQAEAEDREGEMKAKAMSAVEALAPDGSWVTAKGVAEVMGVSPNTATKYLNLLTDVDKKLERDKLQTGKTNAWHWRLRAI